MSGVRPQVRRSLSIQAILRAQAFQAQVEASWGLLCHFLLPVQLVATARAFMLWPGRLIAQLLLLAVVQVMALCRSGNPKHGRESTPSPMVLLLTPWPGRPAVFTLPRLLITLPLSGKPEPDLSTLCDGGTIITPLQGF